jgi:hypothetical protein
MNFFFYIFILHKDIGVLISSNFLDSAHLSVTGLQFLDSA